MTEISLAQQGYEHYYGMLADKVRMQAYRDAIFKTVKPGDVVVDLGAGTGLLSIWAVQAGASKVYAIEKTNAIELAKEIARTNNCADKIEFIKKNSVDVELPERANVLISETLGSFGIDENTLQFTIDARERFLLDDAVMIPQSLELFVTPVDDKATYEKLDFWRHISDINFTPAFDLFSKKIMVESVDANGLLAKPVSFGQLDFTTTTESVFQARQYIPIEKPGFIHGVAGWFNVKLCDGIEINTAPDQIQTHWKQAFFPFQNPVEVIKGDVLDWVVSVGAKQTNSDDTVIQYDYRCTQLKNEAVQPSDEPVINKHVGRNDPCPCGSGKKFKK
ncbi:MAG: 50S ribosomal protein L11 methyltransferase, partial [Gammaproteobacteria bacterium]|nr:50S ribosomal protein L11 methyltransferase [Gammaproteobacteria bacterium]